MKTTAESPAGHAGEAYHTFGLFVSVSGMDRKRQQFHDGREDGLSALESIDLSGVRTFSELVRAMSKTAFGGRQLGEAHDIFLEMARREDCHVVLTISGAMTVAKQGRLICEMIDHGLVHTVVTTGALIAHGLTESIGMTHYRHAPSLSDELLFERGYNRIYDTLEMESNLDDVERLVRGVLDRESPSDGVWSSARLCRALGRELSEQAVGLGILRSAFEREVPVFIPAITDSETGLDIAMWAACQQLAGLSEEKRRQLSGEEAFRAIPAFNPFIDLQQYATRIGGASCLGIFTVGGGVPRNWAQQVGPYYEIANSRLGVRLAVPRFQYGIRICPEPAHWGGLSGCTYTEGVSWGKFVPESEGGRFAEIHADATLVWPLLLKSVLDEMADDACS
ncbi:MAG: deoxyhypusine synthase family protein [Pirellulaceae bacterium]